MSTLKVPWTARPAAAFRISVSLVLLKTFDTETRTV